MLPDFLELTKLSDEELAGYDIAAVNLACSVGLPGAEIIDVPGCLAKLDEWAEGIRRTTKRLLNAEYPRRPAYTTTAGRCIARSRWCRR